MTSNPDRRTVLRGAVAAGALAASGGLLTACGGSSTKSGTSTTPSDTSAPAGTTAAGSSPATAALAKTTDIPVGGGKIFADAGVVVTQPVAGTFKGFSSKCTHQGCPLASVTAGVINCGPPGCGHGSKYSATDGSVKHGPTTKPLPEVAIKVTGTDITKA